MSIAGKLLIRLAVRSRLVLAQFNGSKRSTASGVLGGSISILGRATQQRCHLLDSRAVYQQFINVLRVAVIFLSRIRKADRTMFLR